MLLVDCHREITTIKISQNTQNLDFINVFRISGSTAVEMRAEEQYQNLTDEELVENGETILDTKSQDNNVYMVVNSGRSQHTGRERSVLRALVAVLGLLSVLLLAGNIALLTQKPGTLGAHPLLSKNGGQDMQDQTFCFAKHTDTDYVKIIPNYTEPLVHLSLCMKYKTKYLRKEQSLFSLANHHYQNAFLLFIEKTGKFSLSVNNEHRLTNIFSLVNQWNSVCASWSSCGGESYLWLNGQKFFLGQIAQGQTIQSESIAMLGQEQDSHGGHLDLTQCFVGVVSDVYLWGYGTTIPLVTDFMQRKLSSNFNDFLINWTALNYTLSGDVSVMSRASTCTET
ncbi:serum amyloid P-component-like [Alosa sapidissima]|uniref:serum amyloid P-component-like n=1 Tax=Alosa sapidissima TaxID=34773 RepID=UPI001C08AE33|nr:serum amyloid P-component-like [Alosa sapidissima]